MEENINQVQQRAESHLQSKLNQYKQWKNKADADYANQQSAQMETDTMNLYKSWLEATDTETKKKYQVASRANLLAEMISNTAKEKGVELTWNAKDIVSSYLKGFPDDYQKLMDFTHSNQDPEEFAIEMWWMQAPEPQWWFWRNVVGWAWDAATWLWQFIGNSAADIIWWTAKQLGADEDRVNYLVDDFKKYLDDSKISKTVDADTNSGTYKTSKALTEFFEAMWLWALGKWAIETKLWWPLVTRETPTALKSAVWALEWAADMAIYKPIADQELASPWELATWALLWGVAPRWWAALKAGKSAVRNKAVDIAENTIGSLNKMSKWKQNKFFSRVGEKYTTWMNDRGIKNGADLINYFEKSKWLVDDWLAQIEWRYTSKALDDVMDDVVKYSKKTKDPMYERLLELQEKNKNWWLTMSETNEVKRYFENKRKFSYGKDVSSQDRDLYTNMDNNLREWQFDVAKQNWFNDIAELNKETQNAYAIWKWIDNNNALNTSLWLSDWLVIAENWVSAKTLEWFIAKKVLESTWFKENMIDILNRIWRHQNKWNRVMDLMWLSNVKSKSDLQEWFSINWDDLGDAGRMAAVAWVDAIND